MIKVEIGAATFDLPESWPDVIRSGHYLDVIRMLAAYSGRSDARADLLFRRVLFEVFAHRAISISQIPDSVAVLAADQLHDQCFPVLDFIFDELCTDNPFPQFKLGGHTYMGRGDYGLPLSGGEMQECAWSYSEYSKTGDITRLNEVIDILYRAPDGKLRKPPMLSSLISPLEKMGIKFWYESCEAWWHRENEKLYAGGTTDEEPDSFGIARLIRGLAGDKRGTVEEVKKLDRAEIYFEMTELHREAEQRKEELANMR